MVGLFFLKILSLTRLPPVLGDVGPLKPDTRDEAGASQAAAPRVTQQS
jgi:hypothetical protein